MHLRASLPRVLMVVLGLLILGGLGAIWPSLVGADAPDVAVAPEATVGDAITYQGYLTDENLEPLEGTFSMRFRIYNAQNGGTLLWDSGNMNVGVTEGLFAARLAIAADIFNGEELWVAHNVGGQLLSPRQEILPAPMAHTLRPGAIIKGTANAFPNNYAVEVFLNNDVFAFNRGAIRGETTTGNAIYGLALNGRAVYGQTQDGYGVYGFDGGSNANQGYAGYFYSTNGIGVYGYSNANRTHPNILAPGVYGQSNQGVGVYGRGDTSGSYTFYNEGGYFDGGRGIYARGNAPDGSVGYGARVYSDNYRGMYVQGDNNWFDTYFGGDTGVSSFGYLDRSLQGRALVVNQGATTIQPGDLVAMVGITESPENGKPMLAVAAMDATNARAVIGVAAGAMRAERLTPADAPEYVDFSPQAGPIPSGGYLVMITEGLAPAVNLPRAAQVTGGVIGDKVLVSGDGGMTLAGAEVDGIVIGRVVGPVDAAAGTIPLFLDID